MKRHWQIMLAALLVAISTTDVASACGLTRGLFGLRYGYRYAATSGPYGGWSVGSTAGSVSRDLPSCANGSCAVEKKDDAAAPACSGDACDVEAQENAAETTAPTCDAKACVIDGETTAVPTCSFKTEEARVATPDKTLALSEVEVALGLELVDAANRSRLAEGLRPLELDERFVGGARAHSQVMASWRSCFHLYPPTPEICAAWQTSPEAAVQDWTLSGGHAAILFGARYTKIAPGVAHDAEGRLYWTLRIW